MKEGKVTIRLYNPGDAKGINSMFTKYFPYKRDEEFWVWINRVIGGESIISIAEYNNKVIGHYAIIPRTLVVEGRYYNSGLGVHAVVDPEFRDKVSIFEISNLAYNEAKKRGISFIYGFPNANYRFIQERLEKWKRVSVFNAYELNLHTVTEKTKNSISFDRIIDVDYSKLYNIQLFFEKDSKMTVYPLNDGKNWLLRYILHPQQLYKVFEIVSNSDVLGYVVTKDYIKENLEYRHIVDYVFKTNAEYKNILRSLIEKARDEKADYYSVWKGDMLFERTLLDLGFKPTGFDTFLGVKILDKTIDMETQCKLTDFAKWRLVMGDTDSF